MEQVEQQGKFSCTGCGKSYRWKPELAGRKVKCKCGGVMVVPKQLAPPPPADDLDDALYALADDAKQVAKAGALEVGGLRCPSCQTELEMGTVICTGCGFNLKTGKRAAAAAKASPVPALAGGPALAGAGGGGGNPMLGYAGTVKKGYVAKDDVGDAMFTEYYLPIGMILFGLVGNLAQVMYFQRFTLPFGAAMTYVGVSTIIDMVLIAIGCLAAMKILEISFGAPGPAALKLAAIALAPSALANIVSFLLKDPIGIVGMSLALGMYYCLFYYLFDLDGGEMMMLTAIVWLVRTWVGGFITVFLLVAIMGGVFGGLGGGASTAGTTGNFNTSHDEEIAEILRQPRVKEAKSWLAESNGRLFGRLTHDQSVKIADDLYGMGVKDMSVDPDGPVAEAIYITLPKAKDQRAQIFTYCNGIEQQMNMPQLKDEGYKYVRLYIPGR